MASSSRGPELTGTSSSQPAARPQVWQKAVAFLSMALLYYVVQALTGLLRLTPRFYPPEKLKESAWIGLYEHHFWMMVLALGAIGCLSRGKFSEWGLNLRNAGVTWRIFWKFCLVYSIVIFFVMCCPGCLHENPPRSAIR